MWKKTLRPFAFVLACLSVSAGSAFAQDEYFGIVTAIYGQQHRANVDDLGTGSIRLDFEWFQIEPQQNQWNWTNTDAWIADAAARNLTVYVSLAYTPQWAGPAWTGDCVDGHCMPYNLSDWYDFVWHVIDRYKWYHPKIVFGVWNEPNLQFLHDNNSATKFRDLFIYADMARNAAYPDAALGGPETSHHAMNDNYFQHAMDWMDDYWKPQDVVTVHWYPDGPYFPTYMDNVRSRAGSHKIWLTETGADGCNDTTQAQRYNYMLTEFVNRGRSWWNKVFMYVLQDGVNCGWGILRADWSKRPAFADYKSFVETWGYLGSAIMNPGDVLNPGQSSLSKDGRFRLTYQTDGNLVFYRWDGVPLWASWTNGTSAGHAIMQADGNFVVYDAGSTPVWYSATSGNPGAYLITQSDGNVVVYSPTGPPLWWSGPGGY